MSSTESTHRLCNGHGSQQHAVSSQQMGGELSDDFFKQFLSGNDDLDLGYLDPLPFENNVPAQPSGVDDNAALYQLLDWTNSKTAAPEVPLHNSAAVNAPAVRAVRPFPSTSLVQTGLYTAPNLPHGSSGRDLPALASFTDPPSTTPLPPSSGGSISLLNGNLTDLDEQPRAKEQRRHPPSAAADFPILLGATPASTRFHSKPQSSGSVDSGGGADGQTSLTSLLPPQQGVDDLGSSGGGSGGGAMDMQGGGNQPEDVNKHREKNRNAQKRFRARQRERARDSAAQMEALSAQMGRLMQEKAELETRNRILEQVVKLNVDHVEQLQSHKEVMSIEQSILLEAYAEFVSKVERRPGLTLEDAQHWLMGDLMTHGFQLYINRLRHLYAQGSVSSDHPANHELNELVTMRREHEKQGAMFSCFYWAVFSWNLEETTKRRDQIPDAAHWTKVLAGLKLSQSQETEILSARQRLLSHLSRIEGERKQIVSAIGLELLQVPKEQLFRCRPVADLRKSLQAERDAVFDFLFTAVDDTLTPRQEAYLDVQSYPFCPDIWQMACILASKRRQPSVPTPNLNIASAPLADVLPHASAFQILVAPIAAQGIGLRLKRGLIMCQFHTTAPKAAFPVASQAQLGPMTLLDVHCGRWKSMSYYEWQKECLRRDTLVHNELTDHHLVKPDTGQAPNSLPAIFA
ncbi:hypothetical protein WJX73_002038 [Symbiochloris irregularis]|uniref:BZIP domain-containing protein n=1 Tax=Symbiochloris irregularis TaxID=706552 RepID=A0AAW1PVP4_9CHLO